jgi:HAD superfamily hydrolase (TIGR01450 family)
MYRTSRASPASPNATSHSLAAVKVAAIDLDGVVYHGNTMIDGAGVAISRMRQHGWRVAFATNTSVKTRADIAAKLTGMGIPAEEADVLTSAYLAGLLVKSIGLAENVLVIGEEGLRREISLAGATVVATPPCQVLVVGMDTAFSYDKIHLAMEAIAGGAVFIACNRDASYPGSDGQVMPGCGPIVAAIETAVGSPPQYIAGKPNVLMLETIATKGDVTPREILVVGDGLASDIEMAVAFGSPSVLLAPDTLDYTPGTTVPTFTVRSLADLPSLLGGRTVF